VEFQFHETLFYVVTWIIGVLSSSIRVLCSHQYDKPLDVLSIGLSGGFFSFAVVGIYAHYSASDTTSPFFYLAVSALVGLLGKEQDRLGRVLLGKVFKTFGLEEDPPSKKE
jgi:hypothetical protein